MSRKETAEPLYANWCSVNRLGSQVELDFVHIKAADVVAMARGGPPGEGEDVPALQGELVARIALPIENYLRLLDGLRTVHGLEHLDTWLNELGTAMRAGRPSGPEDGD